MADRMIDRPRQDINAGLPQEKDELGRFVTAYSPDIALLIVERIAMGELLKDICEDPGMPSRSTFHRWVVKTPELARAYNAAVQLSATSFEEDAIINARLLADKKQRKDMTGTDVRALDVAMNQFRWSAQRRDPAKYGDKAAINVRVPVQINTMLDLGDNSGGSATAEHPNIYSLHATVTVEAPDNPDTPIMPPLGPTGKRILTPRGDTSTLKLAQKRPARRKIPDVPPVDAEFTEVPPDDQ